MKKGNIFTLYRLVYDKATNTVHNAPGVETRVPGFGQTNTIEYLDTNNLIKYFKPMVDALVSWGYQRGTTVRAAPYDFRYAPGNYGDPQQECIAHARKNSREFANTIVQVLLENQNARLSQLWDKKRSGICKATAN